MLNFMQETLSVWELLRRTKKPIVLYGMGNGADKIIDWCEANGVQVQGVFASDEFVRGQQFRGFTVERYDALRARLGNDLLVVIAFASEKPEVLERFAQLAAEQEVVAPHLPLFDEEETVSTACCSVTKSSWRMFTTDLRMNSRAEFLQIRLTISSVAG